jgi:predicted nucleotidyltransferase component of viral defense system
LEKSKTDSKESEIQMNLPKPEDALHNAQIVRLLTAIADNPTLRNNLIFKGGTCAAMLGYIDRFSVDIDFDINKGALKEEIKKEFRKIIKKLGFNLSDQSKEYIQFVLKYDNPMENHRKTLKIDLNDMPSKYNKYEKKYISEIDRILNCHTIETMFANKLIAFTARKDEKDRIAGRDIYDIHQFFLNGYKYDASIIEDRTKKDALSYLKKLKKYIKEHITQGKLEQDLNALLGITAFRKTTKTLKEETLSFIDSEIQRLEKAQSKSH